MAARTVAAKSHLFPFISAFSPRHSVERMKREKTRDKEKKKTEKIGDKEQKRKEKTRQIKKKRKEKREKMKRIETMKRKKAKGFHECEVFSPEPKACTR